MLANFSTVPVVPIVLLKFFGAEAAGMFALASRLTTSALIGQDALALPILSGWNHGVRNRVCGKAAALPCKIV